MKASDIRKITTSVTKKWTKQRKAEEKGRKSRNSRAYVYSYRVCQTDVADKIIPKAYAKASGDGQYSVSARQMYYAARPEIESQTDTQLDYKYFSQTLLRRYLNRYPRLTASWRITRDDRGNLVEPHTNQQIPVGTLRIDSYLHDIDDHEVNDPEIVVSTEYPTCGPHNRFGALLYVEKEGFAPLFRDAKIAERYDLAIMSCKGQSVVAARKLVDEICHDQGIPLLVFHDFDKHGFEISQSLTRVSWAAEDADRVAYRFSNTINAIDIGLRLDDVNEWNLEPEFVQFTGRFPRDTIATDEEQEFLRQNQRVELNAFTSPDFVSWVEAKLDEHGVKKVVPDKDDLEEAYRRAFQIFFVNSRIGKISEAAKEAADSFEIPEGLETEVREKLVENPTRPWDDVLSEIAAASVKELLPGDDCDSK